MAKFEIKHRFPGSILFSIETESFKLAVEAAVKSGANLSGANLSGADLSGANLSGANLYGASLSGADLSGAKGVNKYLHTPLLMLLDQPGKIRAYKLVNENGEGPWNGGITYKQKGKYSVEDACTDETVMCGPGINLATLDWCMREWKHGYQILVAEFKAEDIAAIPTATDGKFRVKNCVIVGMKDLKEIGLEKC